MCGRYQLKDPKRQYDLEFSIKGPVPNWKPRVNFCPTNSGPFIVADGGERHMRIGHWGLIPEWAKEPKMTLPTFNARAETVREKNTFRSAFKKRRCVVPMDAFYEWSGPKTDRIPHEISRVDGRPLAMAGLWETWRSKDGSEAVTSFTIVVAEANAFMSEIHDRMPVILERGMYDQWMTGSPDEAAELMRPGAVGLLKERLVNKGLNSSRNEGDWLLDVDARPPAEGGDSLI